MNASHTFWRMAAAPVMAILLATSIAGQSTRIDGGRVLRDERGARSFGFYWETHLEPSGPGLAASFNTFAYEEADVIHRIMLDRSRRVYFGYDVAIEPLADADTYRVRFAPLALSSGLASRLFGEDAAAWKPLTTPAFPAPSVVRRDEVLGLNLLTNAGTGQKIVDYVTIQEAGTGFGFEPPHPREFSFASGSPRDFSVQDAELRIREPRLSVNGRLEPSTDRYFGGEAGSIVWLYVPQRGRFLLSLMPSPELGFRQAGEVRGSSLRFNAGSDTISVNTAGTIVSGQAAFNLYVLQDSAWVPTYQNANRDAFTMGAMDRSELAAQ